MKEPLDVEPEDYDLFKEANRAVDEFGLVFEDDEFIHWGEEDMFDDDMYVEYVSEEDDDSVEGLAFGEEYSEESSNEGDGDEVRPTEPPQPLPTGFVDPAENDPPETTLGCGSVRCQVCGRY